jgi:hypothetical protein
VDVRCFVGFVGKEAEGKEAEEELASAAVVKTA